ncbi:DNA/RNA non-specific endonuclease [Marinilactibacillus psychrotolerans]|uniref:DNA/RNA non-specific endonuclease n=1 Tax=Marinilactibacillus psychrotolerans TaxID=191770 RepID=UPI001867A9BF|nr:DNA/RNA non-specific endonuclease [Marinilactibacillus psychrotolerans]
MIKKQWLMLLTTSALLLGACTATEEATEDRAEAAPVATVVEKESVSTVDTTEEDSSATYEQETKDTSETVEEEVEESDTTDSTKKAAEPAKEPQITEKAQSDLSLDSNRLIEVDGGNQSGHREANVVVDIGFGDREYWAFTNEHGQLVYVFAKEIVIQDDNSEPVNSNGRYYHDEAKVPGTESDTLDEGHIIADSLGGVGNAYNITPQDSALNRYGDQAYMEDNIRRAGGAKDFEAIITYPNTDTQIPSHYQYTYTIQGNTVVDSFDNVDPEEYNKSQGITPSEPKEEPKIEEKKETKPEVKEELKSEPATSAEDVSVVDTNGNGKVTIKEAKEAGHSMPITKDHWLYKYMDDRDGDGMVGE